MASLERFAEVANDATNIGYLLLAAVLALVMAAIGVVWLRNKLRGLPAKPSRSVGHQRLDLDAEERDIHPPTQMEQIFRDHLRDEAARYDVDAMEQMYHHIDEQRGQ